MAHDIHDEHDGHGDGHHGGGHTHGPYEAELEITGLYGIVAEFHDPDDLLHAAEMARDAGYTKMDAYSPMPIHGLAEAVLHYDDRVPWSAFFGGLFGCLGGWLIEYWIAVIDYAWNVGGKPLLSWPMMIPVAYELTILNAAFSAAGAMIFLNGLPRPYHSIFNAKNFDRATYDRFFLCIEAIDPQFDERQTARFLLGTGADDVSEVAK
jgi:Protein of unknown function (DUF3341)